jgi:hypothetical protein
VLVRTTGKIPHLQLIFAVPLTKQTIFAAEPAENPRARSRRAHQVLPPPGAASLSVPLRDDD